MKALQRSPRRRHATARELGQDLELALADAATGAASAAGVSESLERLFPGARDAAQGELARLVACKEVNVQDGDLTTLWLDVDAEVSARSNTLPSESDDPMATGTSATPTTSPPRTPAVAASSPDPERSGVRTSGGRTEASQSRPAASLSGDLPSQLPPAPAVGSATPWKIATGCLIAAFCGWLAGTEQSSAAPAPSPAPAVVPEAVPASTTTAAPTAPGHPSASYDDGTLEVWATDAAGRRQLIWSGPPHAFESRDQPRPRLELAADDAASVHPEAPARVQTIETHSASSEKAEDLRPEEPLDRAARWPDDI